MRYNNCRWVGKKWVCHAPEEKGPCDDITDAKERKRCQERRVPVLKGDREIRVPPLAGRRAKVELPQPALQAQIDAIAEAAWNREIAVEEAAERIYQWQPTWKEALLAAILGGTFLVMVQTLNHGLKRQYGVGIPGIMYE